MKNILTEKNYPVRSLWILKSILDPIARLVILMAIFLILEYQIGESFKGTEINFYLIVFFCFIAVIGPITSIIITVLRKATFHYFIEDHFLTLRQGIISKHKRHMPYAVIQHLFIKQDLLDKIFGLASLTIENASRHVADNGQVDMIGSIGNKLIIPGLSKMHAEILKGIIFQKIKEHPLEDSQSGL